MYFWKTSLKTHLLPLVACLLFLFLCLHRLPDTYAVNGDMARDSLESLRILKSKDITFIGPPLSIGQLGTRVTYFSSAIYYLGAIGLVISGLSVLGPVVLIALLNASAIFPLHYLIKQKTTDQFLQMLWLLAYITSPIVVMYSRLFWNPSPLIGLGIWGLFFLNRSPILFGIIAAMAVYFHYFGIWLFFFGLSFYLYKRRRLDCIKAVLAWGLCISPFLLFEIRNKFYLTSSFLFNITQGFEAGVSISSLLELHRKYTDNYFPDFTLLLHFPAKSFAQTFLNRSQSPADMSRDTTAWDEGHISTHQQRQKHYLSLPSLFESLNIPRVFAKIDASLEKEHVQELARKTLVKFLKDTKREVASLTDLSQATAQIALQ